MKKRRTAFTLVELLVVIGIIALLISILLPALNKARASAKALQCASHQRQIAAAILMYCNDNKGAFPSNDLVLDSAYSYTWGWFTRPLVGRYLGDTNTRVAFYTSLNIYFCPATTYTYSSAGRPNYGGNFGIGYNTNPFARLWKPDRNGRPHGKLGTIREASKQLILADVGGTNAGVLSSTWVQMYNGEAISYGGAGFATNPANGATSYRHRRKANVAFADGHVETFTSNMDDNFQVNTHRDVGLHRAIQLGQVRYIAKGVNGG